MIRKTLVVAGCLAMFLASFAVPCAGAVAAPPYINSPHADLPVEPTRFSSTFPEGTVAPYSIHINNYVRSIQWSSWGGRTAIGSGEVSLLHGSASDYFAPGENSPVTVTLGGLSKCAGVPVYTSYSLTLAPGAEAPKGWPKGQSGTFPCRIKVANSKGSARRVSYCPFRGFQPSYEYGAAAEHRFKAPTWQPRLPRKGSTVFCNLKWRHWGAPRTVATGLRENLSVSHRGRRVWPARLELMDPIWCPAAGQEAPHVAAITYSTFKLTLYGKGRIPTRRSLNSYGHKGLRGKVYWQRIRSSPLECQLGVESDNPEYDPTYLVPEPR